MKGTVERGGLVDGPYPMPLHYFPQPVANMLAESRPIGIELTAQPVELVIKIDAILHQAQPGFVAQSLSHWVRPFRAIGIGHSSVNTLQPKVSSVSAYLRSVFGMFSIQEVGETD